MWRLAATTHAGLRNTRCLKDRCNHLKKTQTQRSAGTSMQPAPLVGIASQMKAGALTATMFCSSQAAQARRLCDTERVFCFPCEHVAVFGPPSNGGLFSSPEEQERPDERFS
jgi:hypothetical protein